MNNKLVSRVLGFTMHGNVLSLLLTADFWGTRKWAHLA